MLGCARSAEHLETATHDSATQSDYHPLLGSLTWKPIKLADPGTKASGLAKTHRSCRRISEPFESTSRTSTSYATWLCSTGQSTASYVDQWVAAIGLDSTVYGTHSMRRTKATLIYKRTKNLRAVQLLLGRTKLESTVRCLGIEVDDALGSSAPHNPSVGFLRSGGSPS